MAKRGKLKPTDGLGPKEIKRIRAALRDVWRYSHARKLVEKRCTDSGGYKRCEKCKKRTPSFKVDHITPCGDVDEGYIKRLFIPSKYLMGLCSKCHQIKTNEERKRLKAVYTESLDFF